MQVEHPASVANCSRFLAVFHAVSARALLLAPGTTVSQGPLATLSDRSGLWLEASWTPFSVFFLSSAIYQALRIYCLGKGFLFPFPFSLKLIFAFHLILLIIMQDTLPHGAKVVSQPFLPTLLQATLAINSEFFWGMSGLG